MPPSPGSDGGKPADSSGSAGKSTASGKPSNDSTDDVFDQARAGGTEGTPEGEKTGAPDGEKNGDGTKSGSEDGTGTDGTGGADATASADGANKDGTNKDGTNKDGTGKGSEDGTAGTGSDAELDKALGTFDGSILTERGTIQEHAKDAGPGDVDDASAKGAGAGKTVSSTSGSGGSQTAGAGAGDGSGTGNGGVKSSTKGGGQTAPDIPDAPPAPSTTTAQGDALPADLPDAKDDDVVARQLREAAMNETDPVMKEKLWEEYRRYKEGS